MSARAAAQREFDAYLMVDWSSSSGPKTGEDSIWWCSYRCGASVRCENPATRAEATCLIREELARLVGANRSVLVGLDFPYGYPAGFAAALGLDLANRQPWRAVWDELADRIEDDAQNHNNRFCVAGEINMRVSTGHGPFWGLPQRRHIEGLDSCKTFDYPVEGLDEHRLTDRRAPGRAHGPPQPVWKLLGAGSVGSQALVGIPRVRGLRDDPALRDVSKVWPFETGFALPQRVPGEGRVIHAEIWPSALPDDIVEKENGVCRDEKQVRALAGYFASLDERGELRALFDPPSRLSQEELDAAVREEGWILGVR